MATKTINTRIVLKTDTEALWTSNNPVLLKGEIGIASDLNKFKIGDGSKKWSELKYAGLSPEEVTKLIGDNRDSVYVYTVPTAAASDENITDTTAITTALGSNTAKQGDMAIIIREIGKWSNGTFTGTGKQAHTAYVYDGEAWKAMDGNYSADNVYLSKDITMAGNYTTVGNLSKSQNGTGTFSNKGLSVTDAFQKIFTKVLQPTITAQPAVTVTLTGAKAVEAGTTVNPAYNASLSAGSYTYGPATGIKATAWSIKDSKSNTATTATGTFDSFKIAANETYKVTATATHGEGAVAKDNVGGTSSPAVKIASGTKSKDSSAYTGYQQGYFMGTVTTKAGTVTSAIVRGLGTKKNGNYSAGNVNITVPVGAASIIIACPATATGMIKVLNTTVNADMTESFVKQTVKVAGADGDANSAYAKDYNVWVYTPAEAYGSTAALTVTLG